MIMITSVCLTGCGRPRTGTEQFDRVSDTTPGEIVAQAYLFDARVKKDGKPTSVRLEIYRTDSIMAFNGRGYLGKGAFRGTLVSDTLLAYFPTLNEYAHEAIQGLFESLSCSVGIARFDLSALFERTPDSLDMGDLRVVSDYDDDDRPEFVLSREGCTWEFRLKYDRRDDRWWLDEFYLESGPDFELRGHRRTLRQRADVPRSRFDVAIPDDAVRIIP